MSSRVEMLPDGTIRRQEPLGMPWRFESLHAPLPLTRGLVRVFRAVIEVAMLAVFHARQEFPLRGIVALELIGDDDPRYIG
jgi:hypothetical protein